MALVPFSSRSQDIFAGYRSTIGVNGESWPWVLAASNGALVSQRVVYSPVWLRAGETVTNIHYVCTQAATGVTTIKFGIYSVGSVRLALSANETNALVATGLRSVALITPYTPSADGIVLFAVLMHASGVGALMGMPSSGAAHNNMNGVTLGGTQTGQTDLPSPATIDMTATGLTVNWYGWT